MITPIIAKDLCPVVRSTASVFRKISKMLAMNCLGR